MGSIVQINFEFIAPPTGDECVSFLESVMHCFPRDDWQIGRPSSQASLRLREYSEQRLHECLEDGGIVADDIEVRGLGISSGDESIGCSIERIRIRKKALDRQMKLGLRLSSLSLLFPANQVETSHLDFVKSIARTSKPVYGRMFSPALNPPRAGGTSGLLNGLPGVFPVNYFGASIRQLLSIDGARLGGCFEVARSGEGQVLTFADRSLSVPNEIASMAEEVLGAQYFLGKQAHQKAGRWSLFDWALNERRSIRDAQRLPIVFPLDLEGMLF